MILSFVPFLSRGNGRAHHPFPPSLPSSSNSLAPFFSFRCRTNPTSTLTTSYHPNENPWDDNTPSELEMRIKKVS